MSVMVSVEMPLQATRFDEAVEFLRSILPDTRAFEGCEWCHTYLDRDGARVLLVEQWAAAENQQAYLAWRVENGFMEAFGPFLASEPIFGTWEIAADV